MWIKGLLSDINGNASSARLISYLVFVVSTYCILKAFNAQPLADPTGLAALLGAYIGAFLIPGAIGKFADRPAANPVNVTAQGDANVGPVTSNPL